MLSVCVRRRDRGRGGYGEMKQGFRRKKGKRERPPDEVSPSLSPLSMAAIKHSLDNRIIKRDMLGFGVNTLLNQHV